MLSCIGWMFVVVGKDGDAMSVDVGDLCICCRRSTEFGSGRFVNRVPADDGVLDGWLCVECADNEGEE